MRICPSQSKRHKAEGRINQLVDHGQSQTVAFTDAVPIGHTRSAQRIDANFQARAANGFNINHSIKIVDVSCCVVMLVGGLEP